MRVLPGLCMRKKCAEKCSVARVALNSFVKYLNMFSEKFLAVPLVKPEWPGARWLSQCMECFVSSSVMGMLRRVVPSRVCRSMTGEGASIGQGLVYQSLMSLLWSCKCGREPFGVCMFFQFVLTASRTLCVSSMYWPLIVSCMGVICVVF